MKDEGMVQPRQPLGTGNRSSTPEVSDTSDMSETTGARQVSAGGRRRFNTALLTSLAGAALPGGLLRSAMAADRSITIGTYTGAQGDYMKRVIIPDFEKKMGCKVYQTQGATLGQLAILRTQKASPTYSVMFMDDVGIPTAKTENLIEPLTVKDIPNLSGVFSRYLLQDSYAAAFACSTVSPAYNTNALHGIDSYAQLWEPRFAGRLMLPSPALSQSVAFLIAATSLATGLPFAKAQYKIDDGWAKMQALKPNVQTMYDSSTMAVLQVAQGQADVSTCEFSKTVLPYTMKKAAIDMSHPKEGVFAGINCITLVKNAPNRDLAVAFINYMLDPMVQGKLAEATLAAPTVSNVTLNADTLSRVAYPEKRIDELSMVSIDWNFINPKRGAIVEKLNSTFGH